MATTPEAGSPMLFVPYGRIFFPRLFEHLFAKWRLLYKDFTGKIKYFVRFLECMYANLSLYSTVGFYIFLLFHLFMVMDFLTKILFAYFFSALKDN